MSEKPAIVFSLSDLLRETPTTPKFKTSFLNSPTNTDVPRQSSAPSASFPSYDDQLDAFSLRSSGGSIVNTRVSLPRGSYTSRLIEPLKLPKRKPKNKPSYSATANATAVHPPTPPQVKPYVHSTGKAAIRYDKSLNGSNCCFCEEPLEYTMAGEKVLPLTCGHVTHFQCLTELLDITAITPDVDNSGLPICPNCDQLAIPLDPNAYHDMVKSKLLNTPSTPPSSFQMAPPQLFSSPQSQQTVTTTATATTAGTLDSSHSPISDYSSSLKSPASSVEEAPKTQDDTYYKQPFQKRSQVLPPPDLNIISELEELTSSSYNEQFARFVVSVSVPEDIFSRNHFYSSFADVDVKQRIAKRLKYKVKDWRHLGFDTFGKLRLCDKFLVSRDEESWQEMVCYLFQNVLLLVREYDQNNMYIKASVEVNEDVKTVKISNNLPDSSLVISTSKMASIYLYSPEYLKIDNWYASFLNPSISFPVYEHQQPQSSIMNPIAPVLSRPPVDIVTAIPICALPQEHKFSCIKATLTKMLEQMAPFDRLGIVLYSNGQSYATPLNKPNWSEWSETIRRIRGIGQGEKNDSTEALKASLKVFNHRETDQVSSFLYLLGDSSNVKANEAMCSLMERFKFKGIKIHSFGCTVTHKPDTLVSLSSAGKGTYFYVREWKELESCILGRFNADKSYTHKNARLTITPKAGISVSSITGAGSGLIQDVLDRQSFAEVEDCYSDPTKLNLGNLVAGQTLSILVQVAIPPQRQFLQQRREMLDLFDATIAYEGFTNFTPGFATRTGSIIMSGAAETTLMSPVPPSPLNGNIIFANEIAPFFSAVEKRNIHVVRRRIQLAVASNMGLALNHVKEGDVNSAYHVLMDSRPLMKGLVDSCVRQDGDGDIFVETKNMTQVLDRDIEHIATAALKPIAFENDVRKWVLQTIGILENEMAFTRRSQTETLFCSNQTL